MLTPRGKKKGIEVSHWKVINSDAFQGLDTSEDYDIQPAPSDECETMDTKEEE